MIKNVIGLRVNCPLFLSDFKENRFYATGFGKNSYMSNFMETRPMGAELFQADGQTERHHEVVFFA